MACGRRRMTCVPYRRTMQRSQIVRKVIFTIRVSLTSTSATLNLSSPRPDTVWQLIGLTNWVVDFLERLMKECILFGEQPAGTGGGKVGEDDDEDDDDLFGSASRG